MVGANENQLSALLGVHSQTNLGHQVAKVGGVDQPLGSCNKTAQLLRNSVNGRMDFAVKETGALSG